MRVGRRKAVALHGLVALRIDVERARRSLRLRKREFDRRLTVDGCGYVLGGLAAVELLLDLLGVGGGAQAAGLRVGLFILPVLVLLAASGLNVHHRQTRLSAG